jgi:hypothetical protein
MDARGKMIRRIELPPNEKITAQTFELCKIFGHYAL